MTTLPPELRALIESGPMVHLTTIEEDGRPQVSVIWMGLDGETPVTAHLRRQRKLRNIERDPRVVLSFDAPREPGVFLTPYAVLHARATIEHHEEAAWELLNRLAPVYLGPTATFPAPRAPGYLVRYEVERVGGIGPWAAR